MTTVTVQQTKINVTVAQSIGGGASNPITIQANATSANVTVKTQGTRGPAGVSFGYQLYSESTYTELNPLVLPTNSQVGVPFGVMSNALDVL